MSSYYQPPVAPPPYGNPPPYGQPPAPARGPRQYNMLMGYFMFLSPKLWRDVGRNWGGINFFYMLFLLIVVLVPINARIKRLVDDDSRVLTDQIPHIKVTDGVVWIDKPEPYIVADPESGQPVIIVDTTGKTSSPPTPGVLVTRNSIILRDQMQTRTIDLKGKNADIDSQSAHNFLVTYRRPVFFKVIVPIAVIVWVIGMLIAMLLAAAIGSAFNSGQRANLTFGGLMRLSAIAMTPAILLSSGLAMSPVSVGCLIYPADIVMTLVILFFAVKANAGAGGPPNPAWPPNPGFMPPAYAPPPSYAAPPPVPPPPPQQWPPQQ